MKTEQIVLIAVVGGAALYFMSKSSTANAEEGGGSATGTINVRVGSPGGTVYVDGEQKAVVPANGYAALTLAAPYAHVLRVVFPDGNTVETNIQVYEGANPDRYIKHPDDIAGKSYYDKKAADAIAAGNTAEADAQAAYAAANAAAAQKRYSDARAGWQAIVDANNSTLVDAAKFAVAVLDTQLRTGQKIEGIK